MVHAWPDLNWANPECFSHVSFFENKNFIWEPKGSSSWQWAQLDTITISLSEYGFIFLHSFFLLLPLHILIKKIKITLVNDCWMHVLKTKGGFGIKDKFWQMWLLLCCYKIRGCYHKEMKSILLLLLQYFFSSQLFTWIWHSYYYQYQGLKAFQSISSGFKCVLSEALFMKLIDRSSRSTRSLASHEVQSTLHNAYFRNFSINVWNTFTLSHAPNLYVFPLWDIKHFFFLRILVTE